MNNQKIELERLIYMNCVRYVDLLPLMNDAYKGSTSEEINVYIDLYSLYKILYSNMNIDIKRYNDLVSATVNMGIHYKEFFWTRYSVKANIFFIYSKNCNSINKIFIHKYNEAFELSYNIKKDITDMINFNLDLLRTLIDYLPNMYFIDTEYEVGVIIHDLISKDIQSRLGHLVITKDQYNYQLINSNNQSIILRPKRTGGHYYINKEYVFNTIQIERNNTQYTTFLSPEFLSTIYAFSGIKDRWVTKYMNMNTIIKILEKAISNRLILNGYNSDPLYLYKQIDKNFKIGEDRFVNRFKGIDIRFQHMIYTQSPEKILNDSKIKDKYDPETMKRINEEYFEFNPLNLEGI